MPTFPLVVLEIDDNSEPEMAPFTHDASVWSFLGDLNVTTRTGTNTLTAIHAAIDESRFRGYPKNVSKTTVELIDSLVEGEVTWLSGAELAEVGPLLPTGDSPIERSLRTVFEVVELVGRQFSPERVRLVFGFH